MKQNYAFVMEPMGDLYFDKTGPLMSKGWKRVKSFRQTDKDGRIFHCAIFEYPEKEEEPSEWENHLSFILANA